MLTLIFSLWGLLFPFLYLVLMVVVWACTKSPKKRYITMAAMAILPLGIGVNVIREIRAINEAESTFTSLCSSIEKPVLKRSVENITSIYLDFRTPHGTPVVATNFALADEFSEKLTQSLLQGSAPYSKIELQTDKQPLKFTTANAKNGPVSTGVHTSPVIIFWKSINEASKYVAKNALTIKKTDGDELIAEVPLIQMHTPAVTFLGGGRLAMKLMDEQKKSCPSERSLARIIKSAARPSLQREN